MAGFVRPQYAGPQREANALGQYAGAVSELNNVRSQAGQQNLQMGAMEDARNASSMDARNAAWANVTAMFQGAHQLNMQQKQLNEERASRRQSGVFSGINSAISAGSAGVQGAAALKNAESNAASVAVSQGQLALDQDMWGTWGE